jgi:hypothetical protein
MDERCDPKAERASLAAKSRPQKYKLEIQVVVLYKGTYQNQALSIWQKCAEFIIMHDVYKSSIIGTCFAEAGGTHHE